MPFHICGGLDDLIYIPLYLLCLIPFFKGFQYKIKEWKHNRKLKCHCNHDHA